MCLSSLGKRHLTWTLSYHTKELKRNLRNFTSTYRTGNMLFYKARIACISLNLGTIAAPIPAGGLDLKHLCSDASCINSHGLLQQIATDHVA